jgi:predicted alpha/beta hydrolase family esterase
MPSTIDRVEKLMCCKPALGRIWRKFYLSIALAGVTACNGPFLLKQEVLPAQYIDSRAIAYGMHKAVLDGRRFEHVVYEKKSAVKLPGVAPGIAPVVAADGADKVHVYIEGDGLAWRSRFVIADDPTSKNVLMLDLMAMDPARSLYLGRPCYLGRAQDEGCDNTYWTYQRFSKTVVDSMVAAINRRVAAGEEIVLFGHSGGAALAILMAARLPQVSTIVTVAGNLDTGAWVKHHRYTPLRGSLNPAQQPPLAAHVRQLHLLGDRDSVIPPSLVTGWINTQPGARVWRFENYTHNCCWKQQWPQVLRWVQTGVSPVLSSTL